MQQTQGSGQLPHAESAEDERDTLQRHARVGPFLGAVVVYVIVFARDVDFDIWFRSGVWWLFGAPWPLAVLAGWRTRMRSLGRTHFDVSPLLMGIVLSVGGGAVLAYTSLATVAPLRWIGPGTLACTGLLSAAVMRNAFRDALPAWTGHRVAAVVVPGVLAPVCLLGLGAGLYNIVVFVGAPPLNLLLFFMGPLIVASFMGHLAIRVVMHLYPDRGPDARDAVSEVFE